MHPSVRGYVAGVVQSMDLNTAGRRVLEVGSYQVNGGVRDLFDKTTYLGVDIRPGPGVDLVLQAGGPYPGNHDVIVTTEMLEHDPRPWVSIWRMADALRVGGLLVLTTRGFGFGRHDHPADYWRFSEESIDLLLTDAGLSVLSLGPDPDPSSPGVFATAARGW